MKFGLSEWAWSNSSMGDSTFSLRSASNRWSIAVQSFVLWSVLLLLFLNHTLGELFNCHIVSMGMFSQKWIEHCPFGVSESFVCKLMSSDSTVVGLATHIVWVVLPAYTHRSSSPALSMLIDSTWMSAINKRCRQKHFYRPCPCLAGLLSGLCLKWLKLK